MLKRIAFVISLLFLMVSVLYMRTDWGNNYMPKFSYGDASFMEDVVIEQKKSGEIKWKLLAKKATNISNEEIELEDITVLLPDKGYKIKAEKAFYNLSNKNFNIPGEIFAFSEDTNIEGSKLYWDSTTNTLKAERDIKIKGKGFSIEGDDLNATKDKAILNKNVRAVFDGK
ncbi:MAG: LPS export ABC transporter periplasmic protein LptC [Thermodesulfovibrionales bacterium]|nr:LPS export ABC transporter periplasmic protein LptC [Thermodesulfovibrionales bacterium]